MSNDRTIIKDFLLPKESEMDLEYYSLSSDLQIKYKSYYLELKNSYSFKKNVSENNTADITVITECCLERSMQSAVKEFINSGLVVNSLIRVQV